MAVDLSKELLETITDIVLSTISKDNKTKQKQHKDWRLRNTELLLQNFRILKEHCDEIEIELIHYEPIKFELEEVDFESIMKSKEKTRRMVLYIESMLEAYERYSLKAGEAARRRFKTMWSYYISDDNLSHKGISEYLHVHERTVRRDLVDARKEFSVFLFGILGVEDFIE